MVLLSGPCAAGGRVKRASPCCAQAERAVIGQIAVATLHLDAFQTRLVTCFTAPLLTIMNAAEITALLQTVFPQADLQVTGDGGKFEVRMVDAAFEGLRTVQRQQKVYAVLNDAITSGAVHAVTIRAMTPEEGRQAALFGQ